MSGFENVKRTVSGWADTIASLKGPIPYDKKVLIENGLALVSGLKEGLINGFSEVKSDVSTWANELQKGIESEFDSNYFNDLIANIPSKIPAMDALINGRLAPELVSNVGRSENSSSAARQIIYNDRMKQNESKPIYVALDGRVILNGQDVGELIAPTVKIENERIEKMESKVYRNRR